jgi:hypothetical protein
MRSDPGQGHGLQGPPDRRCSPMRRAGVPEVQRTSEPQRSTLEAGARCAAPRVAPETPQERLRALALSRTALVPSRVHDEDATEPPVEVRVVMQCVRVVPPVHIGPTGHPEIKVRDGVSGQLLIQERQLLASS